MLSRVVRRGTARQIRRAAALAAPTILAIAVLPGAVRATTLYWDTDADAVADNVGSGAGLGGTGTWNGTNVRWWDGVIPTLTSWATDSDAVFEGTAGTVTVSSVSANTIHFQSPISGGNFSVNSSTLSLSLTVPTQSGGNLIVDPGVSATVGSQIRTAGGAGIAITGGGTVILTNSSNSTVSNAGATPGLIIAPGSTAEIGIASAGGSGDGYFAATTSATSGISLGGTLRVNSTNSGTISKSINTNPGACTFDIAAGTVTFSGAINGSSGVVTKTGSGQMVSTNSASNWGSTGALTNLIVSGGTMQGNFGAGGTLGTDQAGSAIQIENNATLNTPTTASAFNVLRNIVIGTNGATINTRASGNITSTVTLSGTISGTTKLTKPSTGTISLNNPNPRSGAFPSATSSWTGDITIGGGLFSVGDSTTGQGFLPGYQPSEFNSATPIPYYPLVTVNTPGILQFAHPNGSLAGTNDNAVRITGTGSVVIASGTNKTETIYGDCTYTGTTTINAGSTFRIGAGGSLNPSGSLGSTAVTNNGTMRFRNDSAATTFSGSITGGAVVFEGQNTLTLAGAVAPAVTPTLIDASDTSDSIVNNTTVQVGNGGSTGSISGDITLTGGATFKSILVFNRSNTLTVPAAILQGAGAGGQVKQSGSGTLVLSGANTYTGDTFVNAGTLSVGASNNLGAATNNLTLDGGTLLLTGNITGSTRKITLGTGGGTVNTNGNNGTFGQIDPGNFTKAGNGNLTIVAPSAPALLSPDYIPNWTTAISVNNLTISGGKITVAPRTPATGGVADPTTIHNHPVVVRGNLNLGPVSTYDSHGNLLTHENGALDLNDHDLIVDYTGASPMTTLQQYVFDGLRFNGDPSATAGIISTTGHTSTAPAGNVLVLFENTFVDGGTTVADITDWDGVTVDVSTIIGKYTYFGDANLDGQVNADDYTTADANRAVTAGALWGQGDVNQDGAVTPDDYTTMDSNRGQGSADPLAPSSLSPLASVPEPNAPLLLTLSALGAFKRRRRKARRMTPNIEN